MQEVECTDRDFADAVRVRLRGRAFQRDSERSPARCRPRSVTVQIRGSSRELGSTLGQMTVAQAVRHHVALGNVEPTQRLAEIAKRLQRAGRQLEETLGRKPEIGEVLRDIARSRARCGGMARQ